jgi:hypothetical protein
MPTKNRPLTVVPLMAAAILLAACSSQPHWVKPGHTRHDFDIDARHCRLIATELAREATITKQNPNIEILSDRYAGCLLGRGWSPAATPATGGLLTAPPEPAAREKSEPKAGALQQTVAVHPDRGALTAHGIPFALPPGFRLTGQARTDNARQWVRNFLWQGSDRETLFFSVQRSRGAITFQDLGYPFSPEKDILYDRGRTGGRGFRWRALCRPHEDRLIAIVGTIIRPDERRRIIVTATTTLPGGLPRTGDYLKLSPPQQEVMTAFTDHWTAWLESVDPAPAFSLSIGRFFSPLEIFGQREQ